MVVATTSLGARRGLGQVVTGRQPGRECPERLRGSARCGLNLGFIWLARWKSRFTWFNDGLTFKINLS